MDEQQHSLHLKQTFDTVSAGYDNPSLRFFPESATLMAESLGLEGNERVLDVATGTGHAALAIARLLPRGKVTAVDFSPGMLGRARGKAASQNIRNIEFLEMDMRSLAFPGKRFDAAVCAFGIFFVEDMVSQLAGIASVVKPGGTIVTTGFREKSFEPLSSMMFARLETYGIKKPPGTWARIDTGEKCVELFESAGLTGIRVERKDIGYYLDGASGWWDVVWNGGFRGLVSRLAPEDQETFRKEHLEEVATLETPDGIWLDVGVLITAGNKP